MKKNLFLISLLAMLLTGITLQAQSTYTMITSSAELEAGAKYLIVGFTEDGAAYAMGYQKSNNRFALNVAESGGSITVTVATNSTSATEPFEFELGGTAGAWTIYDALNDGYLYAGASDKNYLKTQNPNNANGEWNIEVAGNGSCVPTAQGENTRNIMRFNDNDSENVLFSCYNSASTVISPVYFFKAGGAPVIDPEPTNYPTNFIAEVDRNSIELSWDDAVSGAQLPRAYLVLGSTSAITVPVDGVAVANDIDASDGNVAYNVLQGAEDITFEGLNPNTTYNFAIFPYTNAGTNIDYKTDGSYPTATATTANVATLLDVDFENSLAPFTAYNALGDQEWTATSYNGVTYAYMNGYAAGASNANEDWLITPNMFANGGYTSVFFSFESAYKFDGDPIRVMLSTDYDGVSEPSDFTWIDITSNFTYSPGNYEWTESGEVNLANLTTLNNNTLYVAFVYTSNTTAAASWEITDVEAFGQGYLSVEDNMMTEVSLHPNPTSGNLSINIDNDAVMEIRDIAGRVVMKGQLSQGESVINVSELGQGVYVISLRFDNGSVAMKKFIKK